MKQVKTTEFQSEVLNASGQVLVDFWAPWCGPCRAQGPILEELASETEGTLKVVKVNVDEEPSLAAAYGVQSIPTLIFLKTARPSTRRWDCTPKTTLKDDVNKGSRH